ncbi:MAG: response regulator [Treponema sp.]|nr:response regulator [Treponema sp.]
MNQVLIIDETPLLREYLRFKLTENEVEVTIAASSMEGLIKIRNIRPDLVIMDYHLSSSIHGGCMEVLKQKKAGATTAQIPVIIVAQQLDQKKILDLVQYNVKKVFTKPIKMDVLFRTIEEILGASFDIDDSPGIVEAHVNDDIIFIELSQGLNRDKLDLLSFKITELIELYRIRVPKIIVMFSAVSLSHADGPNLQKLLNIVLRSSRARQSNIRILTKEEFVKIFIRAQKEFEHIEVAGSLSQALDGLLTDTADPGEDQALIGAKVLTADTGAMESMQLRFDGETRGGAGSYNPEDIKEILKDMHLAAVDDDPVILELIQNTFSSFNVRFNLYQDGAEFISALDREQFDFIFLDLMMPKADGFAVLRELRDKNIHIPVVILSAISQRETVIRAFQMGTKSYLVKPIKPADIFKKTMEILRVNV